MANRFRKRGQVDVDLDSIWSYIAADNGSAANKQLDRIGEVFEMLVDNPLVGRTRHDLAPSSRSFPVGSHIVFYIPLPDVVEIVRVMHGHQDIDTDDMA